MKKQGTPLLYAGCSPFFSITATSSPQKIPAAYCSADILVWNPPNPLVQDWYSGDWQLFNECDIIWQEKGELRTRRPDRVMMRDNEIVVVDFKFGKQNKKYNKQVQGYMQLLTRMGYPKENIKGYLWYVEEDLIEKV